MEKAEWNREKEMCLMGDIYFIVGLCFWQVNELRHLVESLYHLMTLLKPLREGLV